MNCCLMIYGENRCKERAIKLFGVLDNIVILSLVANPA
jgi:hypothetical protein